MNEKCKSCPAAWNSLNGRYCGAVKKYVEHCLIPICEKNDMHRTTSGT